MATARTREEVSERRKRIATASLLVLVAYSLIHWGLPLLVSESTRDSGPIFGFTAGWPSWIAYGFMPLDVILLIGIFLWSFGQHEKVLDQNGEAQATTAWDFVKITAIMFGPVIMLFLVAVYGWFTGTISAVLVFVGLSVFGAFIWLLLRLALDGLEAIERLLRKLGSRLSHSGIGHHVTNYLNAEDIPLQEESAGTPEK